jgi:hypothetical protein
MVDANRRSLLGAGVLASMAGVTRVEARGIATAAPMSNSADQIEADLRRYVQFGLKRAGGEGDTASGNWMAGELEALGYAVERQSFQAPYFDTHTAELTIPGATAQVYAQPIVISTGAEGVSGPLVRVDAAGHFWGDLDGAIALVDLPSARWSSMLSAGIRTPIAAAFAAGARAVVAITNGPTGKVIALNADGRAPMFAGPVALMAPEAAAPFLAAAFERQSASLVLEGEGGTRAAFNFVGRMDRGKGRWLAISTPRSGWFTCAAERGPGVAVWLHLARWAASALPDHDLAFVCNTGHEYEYLGATEAMEAIAPPVAQTHFWLHLGANVAGREWHEIPGNPTPLPNVDSQRFLSVSPALLPLAEAIFAGEIGYEKPVSSAVLAAGELVEVIRAGYPLAAGVFGIHRYHHVAEDDERCINPPATVAVAERFRRFVEVIAAT